MDFIKGENTVLSASISYPLHVSEQQNTLPFDTFVIARPHLKEISSRKIKYHDD